jgi:uncharacterized Zn-binding protein involved in type VI secretion
MPGVTRQGLDTQAGHPCPSVPTAHGPQTYTSAGQSKVFSDGALVVNKDGSAACGDPVNEVSSKVFANGKGVHRLGDATVGEGCFNPSTSAGGSSKVFADDATVPEVVTYPYQDQDGDGVINMNDAFPFDASESVDADGDGVGANTDADDNDPDVQ